MKIKLFAALIILSILLTVSFIFYNSSLSGEVSMNESDRVVETVEPAAAAVIGGEAASRIDFSHLIRKSAHFIEFMLLGIELMLLVFTIKKFILSQLIFMPLFFVSITAVIDEYIQLFTERTSSVSDVLIDISGGFAGMIVSAILIYIAFAFYGKMKRR